MDQRGNRVADNSLLTLLLKLKSSTMESTHVASLVKITKIDGSNYICDSFDGLGKTIVCSALQNLSLQVDDVCLVLYCDNDFRLTLSHYIQTGQIIKQPTVEMHSLNYGIIIGIVYRLGVE